MGFSRQEYWSGVPLQSLLIGINIYISVCVCSVSQLCQILWDPMDLPGSSVHRNFFFQARILKRCAIPFSRGSFWLRDRTRTSCISCIGRQILYHWATLGSPYLYLCLCLYLNLFHLYLYWLNDTRPLNHQYFKQKTTIAMNDEQQAGPRPFFAGILNVFVVTTPTPPGVLTLCDFYLWDSPTSLHSQRKPAICSSNWE